MRLNHILFIVALLCLANFGYTQTKKITITCKILNPIEKQVTFITSKGIFRPVENDSIIPIKYDGTVAFQCTATGSTRIKVYHDYRYFEVYAEPSDSIHLKFDAEIYPTSIDFSGKDTVATHNRILHSFRQFFLPVSNKILLTKIHVNSGLDFRKFMDETYIKKWDFIRNVTSKDYNVCSSNFLAFLSAEINYWYAYNLLHYREEHSSIVSDDFIYLPDAYYDFLNQVLVNDDECFSHPNYIKFLDSYGQFRREHPDFPHGLAARQLTARVQKDTASLYLDINCIQEIGKVDVRDKLLILDKASYAGSSLNKVVAYAVKVKTRDGRAGWVKAHKLKLEDGPNLLNGKQLLIQNFDTDVEKDVVSCIATFDSLGVFADAQDKNYSLTLKKGDEVTVQNELTSESITYNNGGKLISSPFVKIRSQYGIIGWVPTAGIQYNYQRKASSRWESKIAEHSLTPMYNNDYFFFGKSLYYIFGQEIRERLSFDGKRKIDKQMQYFLKNSKYEDLNTELKDLYKIEEKRFTIDSAALVTKVELLDQRSTSLNKRTNIFELSNEDKIPMITVKPSPKDRYPNELNPLRVPGNNINLENIASLSNSDLFLLPKKSERNKRKTEKKIKAYDPIFPDVKYEFKPVTIIGKMKVLKKHIQNIGLRPDNITSFEKNQTYVVQKGRKFYMPDTFVYKILISEPVDGYIKTKTDSLLVRFEPNQTYKITEEGKKLKISGNGVQTMDFIKAYNENNKKISENLAAYRTGDPVTFKTQVKLKWKEKQKFLSENNADKKLSTHYAEYIKMNDEYWYFNELLAYSAKNTKYNLDSLKYHDFIKDLKIQNERALQCPEYRNFIGIYMNKQLEAYKNLDLPDQEIARLTLSGKALQYWNTTYIVSEIKANGMTDVIYEDILNFNNEATSSSALTSMKNAFYSYSMARDGNRFPDFSLLNAQNQIIKLSELKLKVVCIHFWSVYDKKYKEDFKKIDELQRSLNNPNIVFMKVNIDNNPTLWYKAVKKYKNDKYQVFGNEQNTYLKNIADYFPHDLTTKKVIIGKRGMLSTRVGENISTAELQTMLRTESNKRN